MINISSMTFFGSVNKNSRESHCVHKSEYWYDDHFCFDDIAYYVILSVGCFMLDLIATPQRKYLLSWSLLAIQRWALKIGSVKEEDLLFYSTSITTHVFKISPLI